MNKYISLSLLLLTSCSLSNEQNIHEKLIGTWVNKFNDNHKIQLTDNGYCYRTLNGEKFLDCVFLEEQADGTFEEVDYGDLRYFIQPLENDSIKYRLIGSKNGREFSKGIFILKENTLVEITHKTLPGIKNHIDELTIYQKKGTTILNSNYKTTEKIIVPKGFKNAIYIAYDQEEGQELLIDSMGNRIIKIPQNGIAKVKFKENPLILAEQRFEFYEEDTSQSTLTRMREFQHGDYRKITTQLRKKEQSINFKYNIDSTAMFVYGFNQAGREYINREIFQDTIDGNIVMFRVDTISKKLKLNQYFNKVKH